MRTFTVVAVGCRFGPGQRVDLVFRMWASTYAEAVFKVDHALQLEAIPYRCFRGSREMWP